MSALRQLRIPLGFAVIFVVAATLVSGCGAPSEAPVAKAGSGEDSAPEDGGRLVLRIESGINTLNPVLRTTAYELSVLGYLFDGLIELDRNLDAVPGLAKSWTVSDDGLSYRFNLDPHATWSDGRPVTANDVVFSLLKYKTVSPLISGYLEDLNVEKTVAVDNQTVDVVFDAYHAGQIHTLSLAVIPEHIYGKGSFKDDFNFTVVGNGPYRIREINPGTEILLERRDDYSGPKPHVRQIQFRVITNASVAWSALTRGEIDEMRLSTRQWELYAEDAGAREMITFHQFYELNYNFIAWNNSKPPLDEPTIRRALTMGIDRGAVVEHVYHGGARVMSGPYTLEQWAFNPNVSPIPFDPAEASRLLDQAGWTDDDGDGIRSKDGKPMKIEFLVAAEDQTSTSQGQIYQDALKKIGVAIELRSLEGTTLIERVLSGRYEAVFLGFTLDADPDLYSHFHSSQFTPKGSNWTFYSNEEVDQLLVAGQEARSFDERQKIYQKIHELLARDQPLTWLVQPSTRWAVNQRVKNVQVAPGLGFFGWQPGPRDWWIPRAKQKSAVSGE